MEAKCKRCGHEWDYQGKKLQLPGDFALYVLCPSCHTSVKILREVKPQ